MSDCIFCKIINKEIPSKIVYEDDFVLAFEDLNPVAPTHVLVVPKKHINSIMELDESSYNDIVKVHMAIQKVAELRGIDKTGFRVAVNCGEDAGQTVPHLHYHVIGGKKLNVSMN